jgi:hypothetical protein
MSEENQINESLERIMQEMTHPSIIKDINDENKSAKEGMRNGRMAEQIWRGLLTYEPTNHEYFRIFSYNRNKEKKYVRFKVITEVTMKNGVFWDVTPCGSCKNRPIGC